MNKNLTNNTPHTHKLMKGKTRKNLKEKLFPIVEKIFSSFFSCLVVYVIITFDNVIQILISGFVGGR
jgi:hypothetical protein